MSSEVNERLRAGLGTAFIDGSLASDIEYRPGFVSNDPGEGKKVLSTIESELLKCSRFRISVAFITMGGIMPLLQTFKELEQRGVPGEILTTNYLNFSEPKALAKLNSLRNVTLKMYDAEAAGDGFHTKGYIFDRGEIYHIIIGSSNMTSAALTCSREWNTEIVSTERGEMAVDIVREYEKLWNSEFALDFDQFYDAYLERYRIIQHQRKIASSETFPSLDKYKLTPNAMQVSFIQNLRAILDSGENRALLISATGTGKTYASAFAMREIGFKRVLFLVHRGQLARQTKQSYENVFGQSVSMGLVGAGHQDYDKDYIFATVQTMNRDAHLFRFAPDAFDCIILDEAHHSTADTYRKVMEYFKPRLFLGMTATPDKRDDNEAGRNVYELYHYQIAQEIRLQQAMEDRLLCPFHYFGITDLVSFDENELESKKMERSDFNRLTGDERVRHIIEQAEYYGFSGKKVKGLVFCSRIDESEELSKKFNERGFRTIALNGSASEEARAEAFERLAMDEPEDGKEPLDYIFSVEILNEGMDIVEVNQVIMLRPTESPIVFIQQLGRGLRKAPGKEYVVVLDFIGNYSNNFMIPIALSGDRTYNKDNVRRYVMEGGRMIPGESSIHFDEISRKRVLASIDSADFSDLKLIRQNYRNLKEKLGRIPALSDFDKYGEMDVLRIFDKKSLGSYYKFLEKYERDYTVRLSDDQAEVVEFISQKFAGGKRIQELEMLQIMLEQVKTRKERPVFWELQQELYEHYHKKLTSAQRENLVSMMTNHFQTGSGRKRYADCVLIREDADGGDYVISPAFGKMLEDPDFYQIVEELVNFGISRYERDYRNSYKDSDLVLYRKYTYEDVCRLLNWETSVVPLNIGGYKYDDRTKTFPIFINYEKEEDISDSIKYEDHFTSPQELIAISKSGRTLESNDVQTFLHSRELGVRVELFVRKNKDDKTSKEFYYLGRVCPSGRSREFTMPNTDQSAVEIEWLLDRPVREDLYEYIVNA